MKKLYLLFLLLTVLGFNSWGQTDNQWGYVLDMNLYNDNNRPAKASGGGTFVVITPFNGSGVELPEQFRTSSFRQEKNEWKWILVPAAFSNVGVLVSKVKIAHRVDWEGGGSNWANNYVLLFPSGNIIEYNKFRVCNGSQTGCQYTQDLFNQMSGYVDVYIFPKNIKIELKSSATTGISAEDKAKIEAPAGYGTSVYKWVYKKDISDPLEEWKPVVNTSLNGNRIFEANLIDIYGDDYLTTVDFTSNTYIALEYDVYENSTNVKKKEYSNYIDLSNKLIAPKILSAIGDSTDCPGSNTGKITVKLKRPLLNSEIIEFFAYTQYGIKDKKCDSIKVVNDTTYEISKLIAGEYTVEIGARYGETGPSENVTDADHKRTGINVFDPPPISYTVNEPDINHVSCNGGNDGSFQVTAGGGNGNYTLWWKPDEDTDFQQVDNGDFTVTGLKAGIYRYYVSGPNGCILEDPDGGPLIKSVALTEPDSLSIEFLSDKTSEPTGHGRSDGYITARVSGGTSPYTIVWKEKTSGNTITTVSDETVGGQYESKLHDIPAGTYTLTVTDNKGCTLSIPGEITISEPDALVVTITQTGQILCHGDATSVSLSASASGGSGEPYTYKWFKKESGAYTQISTSPDINNLTAGDYKIIASDSSTPPNEIEVEHSVIEPGEFIATDFEKGDVACKGTNNGFISCTLSGGIAPYTFYYKESSNSTYSTQTIPSTSCYVDLGVGSYDYYITDTNGCSAKIGGGTSGSVFISEPDEALEIISFEMTKPSGAGRNDGDLTIKIKGGVPYTTGNPYNVVWTKGGSVVASTISVDGNGVVTSQMINLTKGLYSVEIQDNNSRKCTITSGFNLTEPEPLTINMVEAKHVDCFGNSTAQVVAHAKGGIPYSSGKPYTYEWYKVESGTDQEITNQSDSILSNLGIGSYKVKVTDNSSPVNITETVINVSQPSVLQASVVDTSDVSCFGGSNGAIHISATGGSGGYKLYYKPDTVNAEYNLHPATFPYNSFYLNNLSAGKYSFYVKDVNGCHASISGQDTAVVVLKAPDKALAIISQQINIPTGAGKSDGGISISIDGGTPFESGNKYLVTWKDGNGNPLTPKDTLNDQGFFTSKVNNLPKGIYSAEIKDKNYQNPNGGCILSVNFDLKEPLPLTVVLENTRTVNCFGDNSGELKAHVKGGIPYASGLPYSYKWYKVENGVDQLLAGKTDSVLNNIPAGTYKVKIADGIIVPNVTESQMFTITQPEALVVVADTRMISCFQGNDGYIHISATGGTGKRKLFYKQIGADPDYHVIVDSIGNTFQLDNLQAGTYSLYIQDEKLCQSSIDGTGIAEITLTQPAKALTLLSETVDDPTGHGLANGEIHIQLDGGTPDYTVIWKDDKGNVLSGQNSVLDGIFTSALTGLGEGKYTLEVRDANYPKAPGSSNTACILTKEYQIIQPEELTLTLKETHYITCYQMSDGEITADVKGGVKNKDKSQSPYKYTWYRQDGTTWIVMPDKKGSVLTNVPDGTYKLEVTDYSKQPNQVSATLQVTQPEMLTATTKDVHVTCGEVATISVSVSGGTMAYAYKWNTGDITSEVQHLNPGKYMVFVTDGRGCEATTIARVIAPGDLSVTGKINNPVCYQSKNGSITTQVTGGTAPYTYKWNTGVVTKDIANIGAGIYTVVATDKDGCSFSESFELKDPEPIKVDVGGDMILCAGQSYTLEPKVEDPKTSFNWTGPDGFHSTNPKVELNRAGTYKLAITDSQGCKATDEMQIALTDYNISAEMVVATDVFVNDTIVLVNISSPEPDQIEWMFPGKDSVEVVETSSNMARIIFKQTGEYKVRMRSHVKDCFQDVVKLLTVTKSNQPVDDNFGLTEIKEFVSYPNPNNGMFNVRVELGKISTIRLRLFSLSKGEILDDRTLSGSNSYNELYHMKISPGAYIILLETASGRKSQKVIIH